MISAAGFCAALEGAGVRLVTGVPCSYFAGPLRLLERDPGLYVPAANEGSALAIAAGAELAGRRSAVLIQNSGFGNLVNPLTSLLMTFDLPVLILMSLRGWPDQTLDEPQHAVMGQTSQRLLDALGLPYWVLAPDENHLAEVLAAADEARRGGLPAFVLVPKATIEQGSPTTTEPKASTSGWRKESTTGGPAGTEIVAPAPFGRREALSAVLPHLTGALVFATTGYMSRELYGLADHPTTFYMQGSMGHALALGVGAALAQPNRRVVVIDGDGSVLMHLGTCVTAGALAPGGLLHLVLDNGVYESTGGQRTISSTVDWPALGAAAGYNSTSVTDSVAGLSGALSGLPGRLGPHLVVAHIEATQGMPPPRVTSGLTPAELRHRFQRAACEGAS